MTDKIRLRFKVVSFDINNEFIINNIIKDYEKDIALNDILTDLYRRYSTMPIQDTNCYEICEPNLFKINYNFLNLEPDSSIYNYLEIPIELLENQFGISKKVIEIHLDEPGIGGTVGNAKGVHFYFHTNEKDIHHRPHIHCRYESEEFRVDLTTLEVLDTTFKNRVKTKLALQNIKLNQKELIKYWENVVVNGESIKFQMHLK